MEYRLSHLNPWWQNPHWKVGKKLDYRRKEFEKILHCLKVIRRIPLLVGPRRVGKTTLLLQMAEEFLKEIPSSNILYYSFERADPEVPHTADALEELIATWGGHTYQPTKPRLLLLDEVQNVKGWGSRVKSLFDIHSNASAPIYAIITGSSSFDLLGQALFTLHGVVRHIPIPPFSFTDLWRKKYKEDQGLIEQVMNWRSTWWSTKKPRSFGSTVPSKTIDFWKKARLLQKDWLQNGGFPEFWNEDPSTVESEMLDYFVRRVAYEDLLLERGLSNPLEISRFLKYCYFHPGMELNITSASQELGIPRSTLDLTLDLLNKAGYIRVLPRYGGGNLRQKHVKIYPIDHALIPFGLRIEDGKPSGYALETMVVNSFAELPDSELYYFRKKEGEKTHEIDLIVKNPTKLIAIEIKKTLTLENCNPIKEKFRSTVDLFLKKSTHRMLIGWDHDGKGKGWPKSDDADVYKGRAVEIFPLWQIALGLFKG